MTTISYFPVVATEHQLIDVLSRAAWFLTFCPVDRIYIPIASDALAHVKWRVAPGMDPAIALNFEKLRSKLQLAVTKTEADLDLCMRDASIILHWQKDSRPDFVSANRLADWQRGKKVWQVDPLAVRMEGSFYIEAGLHLLANKPALIEENRKKFDRLGAKLGKFERAYVMATGPSVERYKKFDYTDALSVVCNSVILDEGLMNIVRPQILTFGDPIFHFGPSQYAASFRATLLQSAGKHDYTICIPFKYYGLFVSAMPELAGRTIGIPFAKDRSFNFNILHDFEVKTTANILSLLMVPLATTFASEIGFFGCDGRPLKDNTYFWKHNPNTQFNDKMANIREVHPGFFNIDYNDYYVEHCETLEKQFVDGESRGKRFHSLAFSHIPPLRNRLSRGKRIHAASQGKDTVTVLIVDPDAKGWAGHYMAYNEKLATALRGLGADIRVICRKDIDPGILSERPHYVPALTAHSWEVGNRSENQPYWDRFAQELPGAVEKLLADHEQLLIYMYCGSVEHAQTLLALTQKYGNVHVNINLFWLSFKISKEWADSWRPFLDELDGGTPRFVATVPTRELQTELAERVGCVLDVAPHPSTGISDARFLDISSSTPRRAPGSVLQVLFPSAPRPEKGYLASLECARLLGSNPGLRLLLRHAPIATTPAALSKPLERMPNNARVVEGALSDSEFLKLFEESHIAVLPYAPEAFAKRTSGLLIDAIYHQIPCVVVEGTWLSGMVRHHGCGVVVPEAVPEKLADAVNEIAEHYEEYRRRAADAGKDYFSRNSWTHLGRFLLEGIFEPSTDASKNSGQVAVHKPLVGPLDRTKRAHWDETSCIAQLFSAALTGTTMIDVGAHHGSALRPFLDKGWNIFAFEPDDSNRGDLQARLSKHTNASLVKLDSRAVSNESKKGVSFYSSEVSTGISGLSAFHASHHKAQEVDTVTLREALGAQTPSSIDFLKIDTEGHDLFVLQGFPWERFKPAVIECEFEDLKTVPLGYNFHDLVKFLVEKGYTVYVSEWHPVVRYGIRHDWNRLVRYPCELSDSKAWGNLLAFRDGIDETKLVEAVRKVLKIGAPPVAKLAAAAPQEAVAKKTEQVTTEAAMPSVALPSTVSAPVSANAPNPSEPIKPAPGLALAERMVVSMDGSIAGTNWHVPETNSSETYRWTGPGARATLSLSLKRDREMLAVVGYSTPLIKEQMTELRVEVDGAAVPHWLRTDVNPKCILARVPARSAPSDDATELALVLPKTVAPSALPGGSPDERLLGLAVFSVSVIPVEPALPVQIQVSGFESWRRLVGRPGPDRIASDFPYSHFDGLAYLEANPDVAEAVLAGLMPSALEHYLRHGSNEGRRFVLAINRTPNRGTAVELARLDILGDARAGIEALKAQFAKDIAAQSARLGSELKKIQAVIPGLALRSDLEATRAEVGKANTELDALSRDARTRIDALKAQFAKDIAAQSTHLGSRLTKIEAAVPKFALGSDLEATRAEVRKANAGLDAVSRDARAGIEALKAQFAKEIAAQSAHLGSRLTKIEAAVPGFALGSELEATRVAVGKAVAGLDALRAELARLDQISRVGMERVHAQISALAATREAQEHDLLFQLDAVRAGTAEVQKALAAAARADDVARLQQETLGSLEQLQTEIAAALAREQGLQRQIETLSAGLAGAQQQLSEAARVHDLEKVRNEIAAASAAGEAREQGLRGQVDALTSSLAKLEDGMTAAARAEDVERVRSEIATASAAGEARERALLGQVDSVRSSLARVQEEMSSAARAEDMERLKRDAAHEMERVRGEMAAAAAAREAREQGLRGQVDALTSSLAKVEDGMTAAARAEDVERVRSEIATASAAGEAREQGLRGQVDALRSSLAKVEDGMSAAARAEDVERLKRDAAHEMERVRGEMAAAAAAREAREQALLGQVDSVRSSLARVQEGMSAAARVDDLERVRGEIAAASAAGEAREQGLRGQVDALRSSFAKVEDGMTTAARADDLERFKRDAAHEIERVRVEIAAAAAAREAREQALLGQVDSVRSSVARVQEAMSTAARADDLEHLKRDAIRDLERVRGEIATALTMREAREQAALQQIELLRSSLHEAQNRLAAAARADDLERLKRDAAQDIERVRSEIGSASALEKAREQTLLVQIDAVKAEINAAKTRAELAEVKVASAQRELGAETWQIAGSLSALGSKVESASTEMTKLQQELGAVKSQASRINHPTLNAFNVLGYQAHQRTLLKGDAERLAKHWAPRLGLSVEEKELYYLAHRVCSIENACAGRLAASVNDILLRILVARAVKARSVDILEIGTLFGLGIGTLHEALAPLFERVQFTVIDPLEGYYGAQNKDVLTGVPVNKTVFEENLRRTGVDTDKVTLIQRLSTDPRALKQAAKKRYDLLIIDADHSYAGVKNDTEKFVGTAKPGGYVIFDDYGNQHWPDVKKYVDAEVLPRRDLEFVGAEWHTAVCQVTGARA